MLDSIAMAKSILQKLLHFVIIFVNHSIERLHYINLYCEYSLWLESPLRLFIQIRVWARSLNVLNPM